jgi:hypothetical protein
MKSKISALFAGMALLAALGIMVQAPAQAAGITYITLNDPNAATGAGQGTLGFGINPLGVVVGFYYSSGNVRHGFVTKPPYTTFTEIDVPGAGTANDQGTQVFAINPAGAITGVYTDSSYVTHGFESNPPYTTTTTFNAPGAGSQDLTCPIYNSNYYIFQGTAGQSIDLSGTIAGSYVDSTCVLHGFVTKPPYTTFTDFNASGAGDSFVPNVGYLEGTVPSYFSGINQLGVISGTYVDATGDAHAFVRATNGTITPINVSTAVAGSGLGTFGASINLAGSVAGYYAINAEGAFGGFVRTPNGSISMFSVTGGGTGAGQGTQVENINLEGTITGYYADSNSIYYGFVRGPLGSITTFSVPGAGATPNSNQGTFPSSNDPVGGITGNYVDGSGVNHGFVAKL